MLGPSHNLIHIHIKDENVLIFFLHSIERAPSEPLERENLLAKNNLHST